MIESKNLRKGNWVKVKDPNGDFIFVKVSEILEKGIIWGVNVLVEDEDIFGVEINDEILVKCGFEGLGLSGDFWNEESDIGVGKDSSGNYSLYNNYDLEINPVELKYLHQLQNIFQPITQTELQCIEL